MEPKSPVGILKGGVETIEEPPDVWDLDKIIRLTKTIHKSNEEIPPKYNASRALYFFKTAIDDEVPEKIEKLIRLKSKEAAASSKIGFSKTTKRCTTDVSGRKVLNPLDKIPDPLPPLSPRLKPRAIYTGISTEWKHIPRTKTAHSPGARRARRSLSAPNRYVLHQASFPEYTENFEQNGKIRVVVDKSKRVNNYNAVFRTVRVSTDEEREKLENMYAAASQYGMRKLMAKKNEEKREAHSSRGNGLLQAGPPPIPPLLLSQNGTSAFESKNI